MNKMPLIALLNRPGIRWPAALGASAAETWLRRRRVLVQPLPGGLFAHHHIDGSVILRDVLCRTTPADMDRATRDYFLFEYTPQPGDTVVDIGAGCGEEMLTFSRLVGPRGRVIAVEPHPSAFRRLLLTCRHNKLTNVVPLKLAISDTRGVVSIDDGRPGLGSTSATIGATGTTQVPSVTVDSLVADYCPDGVDLLKMNIEGAERLAIGGLAQSAAKIRHVAISCHDFLVLDGQDPAWFATHEIVTTFLRKAGFELTDRWTDPRPGIQYYVYGSHAIRDE